MPRHVHPHTLATRRILPPAGVAVLALAVPLLGAWGRKGHSVIAEIAWRELTPQAREAVTAIMQEETIQETASWADGVRGQNDEFPWTAPYHYANLPADAEQYDHASMRPEVGNVIDGVVDFAARVTDDSLTPLERKQALMFVVHFVGDLHQPLHAGNGDDRGGNAIRIDWIGGPRNLHSIWDSGINDAVENAPWPETAERIHGTITDAERLAYTAADPIRPAELTESALEEAVGRWVLESRRYANRFAYAATGFNDGKPFTTGTTLGEDYARHCLPIVELRQRQAGIRLANLLNVVFAKDAAAAATTPAVATEPEPAATTP